MSNRNFKPFRYIQIIAVICKVQITPHRRPCEENLFVKIADINDVGDVMQEYSQILVSLSTIFDTVQLIAKTSGRFVFGQVKQCMG